MPLPIGEKRRLETTATPQGGSNGFFEVASDFDCAEISATLRAEVGGGDGGADDGNSNEDLDTTAGGAENDAAESNDFDLGELAALCQHSVPIPTDKESEGENPSLYVCSDLSASRGRVIPFEYQVYIRDQADDEAALQEFETTALRYLADKMHVDGCDSGNPIVRGRSLRRRRLQGQETDGGGVGGGGVVGVQLAKARGALIGLSSQPRDQIQDGECPFAYLSVITRCKNVKGVLVAYFDEGTDDDAIETYAETITNHIRVGMTAGVFVSDSIRLVSYVAPVVSEKRPEDLIPTVEPDDPMSLSAEHAPGGADSGGSGQFNTLGFALIGVGCVVIALIAAVLFKRRWRVATVGDRPESPNDTETFVSDVDITSSKDTAEVEVEVKKGPCSVIDQITMEGSISTPLPSKQEEAPKRDTPKQQQVNPPSAVGAHPSAVAEQAAVSVLSSSLEPLSSGNNNNNSGGSSSNDASDDVTVTTQESGVTLEFDLTRTYSDVSDLTWYGPRGSVPPPPPPQSPYYQDSRNPYAPRVPAIDEDCIVEEEEEAFNDDEDPLQLVASVDHSDKSKGSTNRSTDKSRGSNRSTDRSKGSNRSTDRSKGSNRSTDRSKGSDRSTDRSKGFL